MQKGYGLTNVRKRKRNQSHAGPITFILIVGFPMKWAPWVSKTCLLGMTVDHEPSWVPHTPEL